MSDFKERYKKVSKEVVEQAESLYRSLSFSKNDEFRDLVYDVLDSLNPIFNDMLAEIERLRRNNGYVAESQSNIIENLNARITELERVVKGVLKIKDLWLPIEPSCEPESKDEYEALHLMKCKLSQALGEKGNNNVDELPDLDNPPNWDEFHPTSPTDVSDVTESEE